MESKSLFKVKAEVSPGVYRPVKLTASPSPGSFSWILPSSKKLSKDTFISPNSLYFFPVPLLSKTQTEPLDTSISSTLLLFLYIFLLS